MQLNTFPITLENAFMLSPRVKHFIFKSNQTPAFDYLPGQFITIHFEHDGHLLRRSYSIANSPKKDNRIEFAAGYTEGGPGTALLFNLKPGDTIQMNGPFGRLILKDELPTRYIFVATSTGITPYRAMIDELKKRLQAHPTLQIVILQGVQTHGDVLYGDEFLALAKDFPQVLFQTYLSRIDDHGPNSHERKGYVQAAFPELNLNKDNDIVYLCGNPGMIDSAFTYLKDQGFSMPQVIREKYISR